MSISESARLIKARVARNVGAAAMFNFDDLRRQCDEFIESSRRQGQQIVADAQAAADGIRRQAQAEGVAVGQREGLAAARQLVDSHSAELAARQTQEQLRTVLPAFQAAARALEVERDRWLTDWEGAAVKLSAAIAGRILHRELERQPELGEAIIREALQLAAGQPRIQIHVHPLDFDQLHECRTEAVASLAAVGEAAFVPDEGVSRGGCLIETRHGVIDARLETQIVRITNELLEDS